MGGSHLNENGRTIFNMGITNDNNQWFSLWEQA